MGSQIGGVVNIFGAVVSEGQIPVFSRLGYELDVLFTDTSRFLTLESKYRIPLSRLVHFMKPK